jgi:hypothetical protein
MDRAIESECIRTLNQAPFPNQAPLPEAGFSFQRK